MKAPNSRGRAINRWGSAWWIEGDGRFAAVDECRFLTVTLVETLRQARGHRKAVNETGCGGDCPIETRHVQHYIVDLNTGARLDA